MGVLLWLAAVIILPVLIWYWARRIYRDRRATVNVGSDTDEGADTWFLLYRDVFLALVTLGAVTYIVVSSAQPALGTLVAANGALDPSAIRALEPRAERVLVTMSAFLITFGLSVSFLPKVYPLPVGSRASRYLSLATALCLAAAFSLWLGTSSGPYQTIFQQLTQGYLALLTTFLAILIGAIGSYLTIKRLKAP